MYDNIGKKIKNLATVTFIVEAIATVIIGLVFLIDWGIEDGWWALLLIFFGPFIAWASSWLLYGFGELIDKTCDIERNTRGYTKKSTSQAKVDNERINKLERLRAEKLITEEEYQQAIAKEK